jgi:hypothetical protein
MTNQRSTRHQIENCSNSLAPSVRTMNRFLRKKKSRMVTCDQDLCLYVMILDRPSHSKSTTLIRIRFGRELKHMMVVPLIRALAGSGAVGGGSCFWCYYNPRIKRQLMLNSRLIETSRGSDTADHSPSLLPKVHTVLTFH